MEKTKIEEHDRPFPHKHIWMDKWVKTPAGSRYRLQKIVIGDMDEKWGSVCWRKYYDADGVKVDHHSHQSTE